MCVDVSVSERGTAPFLFCFFLFGPLRDPPPSVWQDFFLTSPLFGSASGMHLHFAYHMFGADMGSLRLESWNNTAWTRVWSREGSQLSWWKTAIVAVPEDAELLRFVGTTGNGEAGDMCLDVIGFGVPTVRFTEITCSFELDSCLWLNTGNFSWDRLAGPAHDGGWFLEAASDAPGQLFVLEGPHLNNDTGKAGSP